MNLINSVIVNKKGIIGHMGHGILAYADMSKAKPFAYPAGRLEKNDIVLFISRNLENIEPEIFERIGISSRGEDSNTIFLGVCDNEEIQPVEKTWEGLLEDSHLLLDTFFCGNYINICWNLEKSKLLISINSQSLECGMKNQDYRLLIIREDEIRYFNDGYEENARNRIKNIMVGESFDAYVDKDRIRTMKLADIFPPEIFEHMHDAHVAMEKFFHYRGIAAMIHSQQIPIGDVVHTIHTILGEDDLVDVLRKDSQLFKKLESFKKEVSEESLPPATFRFLGKDEHLTEVKVLLQKACNTNVSILLTGESGTGKTFLAREIHKNSKRSLGNFIHVNCAAIPYQLIESELFGYEAGAFTGAKKGGKKGYFELAENGTIFLDEIAEIPMTLQGKLLEVIQNRTFYRVGGSDKISVNARLIFATNHDLKARVANSKLREDLYYRINVFPIELQPLRKRKEVIFNIATDILPRICQNLEIEPLLLSTEAMDKIRDYHWPGNIRELENILERATILSNGKVIMAKDLKIPESVQADHEAVTLREQIDICERNAIISALEKFGGDKIKAAKFLDIGRTNMYSKINKHNIRYSSSWRKHYDSE